MVADLDGVELVRDDPPLHGAGDTLQRHQPRYSYRRNPTGGPDRGAAFTVWVNVPSTWLCPSDSHHDHGLRPLFQGDGQYPARALLVDPATGTWLTVVPVANYAGSFGDNYCGGSLLGIHGALPWETPSGTNLPPGQPRIGYDGFWGTTYGRMAFDGPRNGGGRLRGFFDYLTLQTVSINSVIDGTSQSLTVGEVLPYRAADSNFWHFNGVTAGTISP